MITRQRRRRRQHGTALIEFALVSSLMFLLLLGIVEFGLIFKDVLVLNEAARVGVRSAAVGDPIDTIQIRIRNSAISLEASRQSAAMDYSTDDGASFPNLLADDAAAASNNAPAGSLVRVRLTFSHALIAGFVIPGARTITLRSDMVAQRE